VTSADDVIIGERLPHRTGGGATQRPDPIGYRLLAEAGAQEHAFGVHLNPDKSAPVTLTAHDRSIVLAEE
jgi:hypothetical protein